MQCLDANVWIYYLDDTTREHRTVVDGVRPLLESEPVFTTTVLQLEVVHYLHAQIADSESAIDRFLGLEDVLVAELTDADVRRGTDLLTEHPHVGIGGRDATVLAAMRRYDVSRLWTHDSGLKRMDDELDWLDVVDPVAD